MVLYFYVQKSEQNFNKGQGIVKYKQKKKKYRQKYEINYKYYLKIW